jgi:Family of unknown function (DUF5681)
MTTAHAGSIQDQRGRFRKGTSGNPAGKRPGTRHKMTLAAELLLDGEAEKLTRKAIDLALAGDAIALRLCLDRILPPRRERPVHVKMPELHSSADATAAMKAIADSVANGEIALGEASELGKLVESYVRTLESPTSTSAFVRLKIVTAACRGA